MTRAIALRYPWAWLGRVTVVAVMGLGACGRSTVPVGGANERSSNPGNTPVIVNVTQINGGPVASQPVPMTANPELAQMPEIPPPPSYAKPELLINAFCERWIKQDMAGMYSLLDESTRADLDWPAFHHRIATDAEFNGGLRSGTILGQVENLGNQADYRVQLKFQSVRSPNRIVIARVKESSSGWLLMDSGLIPPDLSQQ